MSTRWLAGDDESSPGAARVGGKAMGLYRLRALGLPVPPFVVLSADAYRAARAAGAADVLPDEVERCLDAAWARLCGGALAVRSSLRPARRSSRSR